MNHTKKTKTLNSLIKKFLNNKGLKQNMAAGCLLLGLLIAGFSLGAVMGIIDDLAKPTTTIYSQEARANNENLYNANK